MEKTPSRRFRLYEKIFNAENWSVTWEKRLIVKKSDLRGCYNWKGVTLFPVISKIFCKMLLKRIKMGVDKKFRKDQRVVH